MTSAQIQEASNFLKSKCDLVPEVGIILGTGLGALVNDIEIQEIIPYEKIPHFPVSTVETHSGKLIFGKLSGKPVVVMQGRFHYYEGYNMKEVTFPVRVMKLLGIKYLFVSNAAGGLDPEYETSDLMVINDHINLQYENPLTGPNLDDFGVRFPDMSEPYDLELISLAHEISNAHQINLKEGVYVSVPGPNLETKAEYKYLRIIGADAVGMSTVPEVIVARQMEIPVFAVSVITDLCSPGKVKKITIQEVIAAAAKAEPNLTKLIKELVVKVN
ncbi:purine-nucleoside phosphorylase [Flexithrix dorotheae]|uniref:purine-nucleoside phosphorylase n=1 Tax=Flexithrix dorotheae TaxID=70993 RepID=UPI00036F34EF|nr:purine-nucleoside phosphorylase [Flexithrix dorotheae]